MTDDDARMVSEAADLISKKWHPVLIQSLLQEGPLRFSELRERHDVSAKVLTDSLQDLVDSGLVRRIEVSQSPLRVEYELTSHGQDMEPVIEALATWGERHLGEDTRPTVLLVSDDPRLGAMHADWLADDYRVRRVHDEAAALGQLDEEIDVVLLDCRTLDGLCEAVLDRVEERALAARVVVLSAGRPDLDILELDADAFLLKPTDADELREVVTDVLARDAHDEAVGEYLTLRAKRAHLRARHPETVLERHEGYRRLQRRLRELEAELDDPRDAAEHAVGTAPRD